MASAEQIAAALITAINSELSSYGATTGAVKALDYDDAAGVTAEHVQIGISERFTSVERAGKQAQRPWRLTTRPVATTVSNAREITKRVQDAIWDERVVVGTETSTPIHLESADEIGPDDGKYSGLTTWTFVL